MCECDFNCWSEPVCTWQLAVLHVLCYDCSSFSISRIIVSHDNLMLLILNYLTAVLRYLFMSIKVSVSFSRAMELVMHVAIGLSFLPERDYVTLEYMPSHIRLSSVIICRLSVTFMHPTQLVEISGNVSTPFCTLAIRWPPCKILRRLSFCRGLNARRVSKYIATLDMSKAVYLGNDAR